MTYKAEGNNSHKSTSQDFAIHILREYTACLVVLLLLLLLIQFLDQSPHQLYHAIAERGLEGAGLLEGQWLADAVEKAKGTPKSSRVAILSIDGIKAKFGHLTTGTEIHVKDLGWKD